jgi:hypothetical protein
MAYSTGYLKKIVCLPLLNKSIKTMIKVATVISFTLTTLYFLMSCNESLTPTLDEPLEPTIQVPVSDSTLANGGCPDTLGPVYLEKDGIVLIEAESASYSETSWEMDTILMGFTNKGYLVWKGPNNFNLPGRGILNYKIRITKPGTYRFTWKSRITQGSSTSDFNDSWLRIPDASHFYAKKDNGAIVYPKGSTQDPIPESSSQSNTIPQGSGSGGWFKVYMNSANQWRWRAATSDNDPHFIYAVFNDAADYTVQISGRSTGHGIDKFVLFHDNVSRDKATTGVPLSQVVCE